MMFLNKYKGIDYIPHVNINNIFYNMRLLDSGIPAKIPNKIKM